MVYRTEIKIKPADLTDLTVTTDLSSWNLEQFTIEDNALIGYISATDNTANITISSTGYITQTIAFSDIPPTIYLIPANEVETLSDGTNSYPITDKMARLMLEDKADISDIPTVNNATLTIQKNGVDVQTFTANASSNVTANITVPTKTSDITNDSGYITGITSSDVTTALGYTPQTNITGGATTITSSNLTTDRALISNGSGKVAVSAVTSTELGYLDGVTSAIQTQLNDRITTTTKTVANDGCTFVLSNGFKVITSSVDLTKEVDYSWSYGTTFTNTPRIFISRRTGTSTTVGAYTPWIRGTVGKSSSTIYATTGGNYMLMAIGN